MKQRLRALKFPLVLCGHKSAKGASFCGGNKSVGVRLWPFVRLPPNGECDVECTHATLEDWRVVVTVAVVRPAKNGVPVDRFLEDML